MNKAVVIGGSGFLGSHVADVLSERGYKVTIFDRTLSTWLRSDQEMIVGDILDLDMVMNAMNGAKVVYNFAGIADIAESKDNPYDTLNLNIMGTTIALEAAVKCNVKQFIYASTMYVYSPHGSFYRASKQATETIIEAYHEQFGIDYVFLRYGSLYGPRAQNWNGLRRYVNQVVRTGQMDYWGSGQERREYIYVCDAARLSVDVLSEHHKNQAITVTGQQVLNAHELIELIFEICGVKNNAKFTGNDKEHGHYIITPYRYSPRRAKKLVPDEFVDLGEGVLELVEEIHQEMESE